MQFIKQEDGYFDEHISGIYKIKKYDNKWYAFFKPMGWVNWGNSCEKTRIGESSTYKTMIKAQRACIRHKHEFGDNPNQFEHLTK